MAIKDSVLHSDSVYINGKDALVSGTALVESLNAPIDEPSLEEIREGIAFVSAWFSLQILSVLGENPSEVLAMIKAREVLDTDENV